MYTHCSKDVTFLINYKVITYIFKSCSQKDKMQQNMISYFSVVKRVISLALLIFSSFWNYLGKDCEDWYMNNQNLDL